MAPGSPSPMVPDAPLVALLEPCKLEGFRPGAPRHQQLASVPRLFADATEIRQRVFVEEQKVPVENEFDADDSRSCHWVVYVTSNDERVPVGTIRLVPFPHDPHPQGGGRYWNGILEGQGEASSQAVDRSTSFHDGKEPYVKLGRLAIMREYRGKGLAGLLVKTALRWMEANPSYFDSITPARCLDESTPVKTPRWNGLVCAHAQQQAVGAWSKWGFQVDEAMGSWWEEGIAHLGMFQRLQTT
ncbi:hypothetical protein L249_6183 [Ophiocordyceps polyrhachis-furcata BCC 54312]|uniref:N-acetyltransferase domain-containing protein n=1 Tax=Ophiocordyceps polyrhachis-furcata BCC 54312 TaxID=1330021 RepID=A0A367LJ30_9HYPO|nr:hypothetical protein L249_6183 [Ophiocordyceps polyrhachis-furcata BCC 54312]